MIKGNGLIDLDIILNKQIFATVDKTYVQHQPTEKFTTFDQRPFPKTYGEHVRAVNSKIELLIDEFEDYILVISGPNNFRKKLTPTYKANRKGPKAPYLYDIQRYCVKNWNANVAVGEADDWIAERHNKNTIIVSTDKDFKQCGGWLYDPYKFELYEVTDPMYHFWTQVLTGDDADNVDGIDGIGPKKAEKILLKATDYRKAVEDVYKLNYGKDWFAKFDLACKLLWLKRSPTDEYFNHV